MELELRYLAPYLPYRLKARFMHPSIEHQEDGVLSAIYNLNDDVKFSINYSDDEHIWMYKPILRPLTDLYNDDIEGFSLSNMITHGFHNDFWYADNFNVNHLMYLDFIDLVSYHFDVFRLIDNGLAIDINTINK